MQKCLVCSLRDIYIYSRQLIERQTFGGMLVISKYPPLCPHSPQYPLDTVWKETSWSSLLMGGPISLKTFQCYSKLEYKYNLKLHAKTQTQIDQTAQEYIPF